MNQREIDELIGSNEFDEIRFKTELEVLKLVKGDVETSMNRLALLLNFFPNYPESIQILRDLHAIVHGANGVKNRILKIKAEERREAGEDA